VIDGANVISAARFRELERDNILLALERCGWRISGERGAAKLLGLKPSTLAYQMKTLGIERRLAAERESASSSQNSVRPRFS
jgi:transcriptional regulator with GAF, ATPase, and Fis domain